MQNQRIWRTECVFIHKNVCISGPMHFKPVLFKGQLYIFVMVSEHLPPYQTSVS